MAQTLLEMTKDLTRTLVETGMLSAEDMPDALQKTHTTLTALKALEESGFSAPGAPSQSSPGDWRTSITRHAVTCLECGDILKQLTRRHLMTHRLDPRLYRLKYAIPSTQPLVARATTERHRQVVRATRPWEKTQRYLQSHTSADSASPVPDVETLPEFT